MNRILPSHVVAAVNRAFPGIGGNPPPQINHSNVAQVGSILDLYERVHEDHFSLLSPDNYARLITAVGEVRAVTDRWRRGQWDGRGPVIALSAALRAHPLAVVRDLLVTCPDAVPPQAAISSFAFIADPELVSDLERDAATSYTTLGHGEYKPSCVMAGSVCEALLLWAIQRREGTSPGSISAAVAACRSRGEDVSRHANPDRWDLSHLVSVARELDLVTPDTKDALNLARESRNLIHPGRSQRLSIRADRGRAHLTVGAMEMTAGDLASRVVAGVL